MENPTSQPWWQSQHMTWIVAFAFAVPLLWPTIPPLTDLPTHMGRYRVALDLDNSPHLGQYYHFQWALFGNLGVDLLVMPLAQLFGLEPAVKLIALTIPSLTAAGMLLLSREAHGKLPPTSLFALPLAYALPFQTGFLNFTLGAAFAILAAALWLRLGRLGHLRLRIALSLPVGCIIWLTHAVAWGMLGLIIFGVEYASALRSGLGWWRSGLQAILKCLPLSLPTLLMLEWWTMRSTGESGGWQIEAKLTGIVTILRDTWQTIDLLSALLLFWLLLAGARGRHLKYDGGLGIAAVLLFVAFIVTPFYMLGSAFADIRLAPYAVAVGILALRPPPEWTKKKLQFFAMAAIAFVAARLGMQTYSYWMLDSEYRAEAVALDHIPQGAAIFALVDAPCFDIWNTQRVEHLASLATVRRHAFVNGQWSMPGGRLLSVRFPPADGFALSPTQLLRPEACRSVNSYSLDSAMELLPRQDFDYVWLINVDESQWPRDPQLKQVWRNDSSVLFKIYS